MSDVPTTIKEMTDETKKMVGVATVSFGASNDTKVSVKQWETTGVFASMSMTFDLSAFTGEKPIDQLFNEIVMPLRNSFTKFAHAETMSRIEELRAIVEGIRDGKTDAQIERKVQEVSKDFLTIFNNTFEVKKDQA